MRSSYSGSVIGPKMSTCTLPRMFMPAPWITRTLGIALSVRTGMVGILPAVRVDSAASVAETRRWHTPDSDQEDHTHDHDGRLPGQGSRHARAHDHRRDGPALHQGSRRAEPVVHDGLAVRRTGGAGDRLSAGGQRVQGLVSRSAIETPADLALALVTFALLALWGVPAWLVVVIAALGGAVLGAV